MKNRDFVYLFLLINVFLFPDTAGCWEDIHDIFCSGDFSGLFLSDQLDPGCGRHGLRRTESSNHGRSRAERSRISTDAGTTEEATRSSSGIIYGVVMQKCMEIILPCWAFNNRPSLEILYSALKTVNEPAIIKKEYSKLGIHDSLCFS